MRHYDTLQVTWFLQYNPTHPTSPEKQARSQSCGHFYLTNHNDKIFNNGAVLTISSIINHIMALASEAELSAMFYNYRKAIHIRITLEEMGYPQPPTNITVNNSTAHGLTRVKMIPKNPKQWTCVSIGSSAGNHNTRYATYGDMGEITEMVITPNITHPNIIDI